MVLDVSGLYAVFLRSTAAFNLLPGAEPSFDSGLRCTYYRKSLPGSGCVQVHVGDLGRKDSKFI
jgi:hypothetical protein